MSMQTMDDGVERGEPPRPLNPENFEPLVGRTVRFAGTQAELVLVKVDRLGGLTAEPASRPAYSLLFSGPRGHPFLPEGIHRCDFGDGAVFDIHVAPIYTSAPDRQNYQSVFN